MAGGSGGGSGSSTISAPGNSGGSGGGSSGGGSSGSSTISVPDINVPGTGGANDTVNSTVDSVNDTVNSVNNTLGGVNNTVNGLLNRIKRPSKPLGFRAELTAQRKCCFLFEESPCVKGVTGRRSSVFSCRSQLVDEVCSFLFRRSGRRSFLGAASAAQFHAGPSGGQKAAGARRGSVLAAAGAGGLKGSSRASMCQAAIRSLRATDDFAGFLPWRALTRR